MTPQEINSLINAFLQDLGISHFGMSRLSRPLTFEFYHNWLQNGFHGEMKYLETHSNIKEKPEKKWPRARSAFVFAMPYFPHPELNPKAPLKKARVSLYAQGVDYHFWFKQRMAKICEELHSVFPHEEFIAVTDSTPVLERDLAYRSGLGWFGKNTCLIHPKKGSLFFIGEILTSLEVDTQFEPLPDFCGKCTKCIDSCPTGAIIEPRKLDARKCISYLTIESRDLPPENLIPKMGDWLFGCDICQTVCPWNEKLFKGQLNVAPVLSLDADEESLLIDDLRFILSSSGKKISREFMGTPLARAGSFGLKRNALVIIGNKKLNPLRAEVESLLSHEKLAPLARWTLSQLV